MQIIRNREIVEDHWQKLSDETPIPSQGDILVSLERWNDEKENLKARQDQVGVSLENSEDVWALGKDVLSLPLIALSFPRYSDGRAYSQARILRDHLGYQGELRASGDVLRDQLMHMERCGINTFEVREDKCIQDALKAFTTYSVRYQGAVDRANPLFRTRCG